VRSTLAQSQICKNAWNCSQKPVTILVLPSPPRRPTSFTSQHLHYTEPNITMSCQCPETRRGRQVRLSWQHSVLLYQHRRGVGLQISQNQRCLRQTERPCLRAPGPEARNQIKSLQGSCSPIPALCMRDMGCPQPALQTTQRLSHQMSEDPASHQVAGQSARH